MPTGAIVLFVVSAVMIVVSGIRLPVVGKDLAARMGIGETATGLFVLAIVTSLPELSVTITAMLKEGAPDIALGNVIGSNNFNATAIAFIEAIFIGGWFLGSVDARRYTRTCWLLLALTVIVGLGVLFGAAIPPWAAVLLFSIPIVVIFLVESLWGDGNEPGGGLEESETGGPSTSSLAGWFVVLSALVIVGGFLMAISARQLADHTFHWNGAAFTLGQTFVGTLFVAIATSLPEVSVAYGAIKRARSLDIALGTLLGSNSINILIFALGAPLLMLASGGESAWSSVSSVHLVNVAGAVVLTVLVLIGMTSRWCTGASWRPRFLTALMIPVYLVCLYLVRRGFPW